MKQKASPQSDSVGVFIKAPNIQTAQFTIIGTAPLVIHRFSKKTKDQLEQNMKAGKTAASKKNREQADFTNLFNESRYISQDGWDGFNATSVRAAMIASCRLINFKMVLAKMSVFVLQDGWDKYEPQIPLVRIYGEPVMQTDMARVANGNPYVCVRAAYHGWKACITIRFDADQFTRGDIANLLARVGIQNGLGEGRPNSKEGVGMGWGTFRLAENEAEQIK